MTSSKNAAVSILCAKKLVCADEIIEDDYLHANPGALKLAMSAHEHFSAFAASGDLFQCVNRVAVDAMRSRKIARLKFKTQPVSPVISGAPLNFLTPELIAEFNIPDTPPTSSNEYGGPFIDEIAADNSHLCLDLGAGLRYLYSDNIVNADIYPSISTDIVCIGEDLPFESNQFDYVICMAVLEHTLRPWRVAEEICRVLKPGGKMLIDYPFLQGVHGYPHHYFNATPEGAASLFRQHCDILSHTIEPGNHPIHALWWFIMSWRYGLFPADRAAFDKLTIGDINGIGIADHMRAPYCANLTQEAQRIIPAGSTLIAQKRADGGATGASLSGTKEPSEIDRLKAEIAALRASRSWKITAPLRWMATMIGVVHPNG